MSDHIDDLTALEWRDTNWIDRHGGLRNSQLVLDYFSFSPFWDPQCNNALLRMQTQFNDLQQTVEGLRKMTGVEFAVVLEQPPVYVIQKQKRRGPDPQDVTPLATFYVNGANVYQSPTLYAVIANRLLTSLFHVNSAFQEAHKLMQFQPSKGYTWKTSASITGDSGTATMTEQQKLLTLGSTTKTRSTAPALLRQAETHEFREIIDRTIHTAAARVSMKRAAPVGSAANRADGLGIGAGAGVGLGAGGQAGARTPARAGGGETAEAGTPLVQSNARLDDQVAPGTKRRKKTDELTVTPTVKRKKKTSK